MAESEEYPSLQVNEDLVATQRTWKVQRVGWTVLALFLLGGLLGVFGSFGPFASGTIASSDGNVLVTYPQFGRYVGPTELAIDIAPGAVTGDTLELRVANSWVGVFELYGISPKPASERLDGDDTVYTFEVVPGQDVELSFFGRPHHVGPLPGSLQLGQGERLAFSTFVYP